MFKRNSGIHLPPISPATGVTLYEQVVEGIKREIGSGRLKAHDALPSFRELAEELLVSVITVKRAYEELERDGIIYRRQGLGTFVAEDGVTRSREVKRRHVEDLLRQVVDAAPEAGVSRGELLVLLQKLLKERED